MSETQNKRKSRYPRKLLVIKPSKYEFSGAVHANREYWNRVFKDPHEVADPPLDSHILLKTLPPKMYDQVCRLLQFSALEPEESQKVAEKKSVSKYLVKEPLLMTRKHIRIERDLDSDTDVELGSDTESIKEEIPTNVHLNLLKKPEREQITWNSQYLQPEEEHEKNLVKKADDLTNKVLVQVSARLKVIKFQMKKNTQRQRGDKGKRHVVNELTYCVCKTTTLKIAKEFCTYMQELGGNQQSQLFTPDAIKELFQIEFDTHVARGLQVVPKELPVVEDSLAAITGNPELSKYSALERLIAQDIKAESATAFITGFGRSVDLLDQVRPPTNDTKNNWRSARHVPKDLITLKTVWEGITNLKSVKEYCRWMIDHPEHEQPLYLKSLGMFDPAVLHARLTIEEEQFSQHALHRRTKARTN